MTSDIEQRLRTTARAAGDRETARAATRRLAARAAETADVVYTEVDAPLGPLLAATTPRGLVRLAYLAAEEGPDATLDALARRVSPRIVEARGPLDPVRRELDEYFAGRRTGFDLPVDLGAARGFGRRVLAAARKIPYGRVQSYREVAAGAGNAAATRAAGNALGANPVPIVVPCHRVVRTGGGLGGYTGGLDRKRFLLALEGVEPETAGAGQAGRR